MNKLSILIGYLTSAVGIIGSIVLQPLLLHSLGHIGYVQWNEMIIYAGYLSCGLTSFQSFSTIVIAKDSNHNYKSVISSARISIGLIYLVILTALFIYNNYINDFSVVVFLVVSLVFVKAYFDMTLSYYYGMQFPIYPKVYELLSKLSSTISIFIVSYYCFDINHGLVLYFFGMSLIAFLLYVYDKFWFPRHVNHAGVLVDIDFSRVWIFVKKVLPYIVCNIPNVLLMSIFILLIAKLYPSDAVVYIFYFKVYSVVNISFGVVSSIYSGRWALHVGKNNFKVLYISFVSVIMFLLVNVTFVFVIMALFGKEVFDFWIRSKIIQLDIISITCFSLYYFCLVFRLAYNLLVSTVSLTFKDTVYFVFDIIVHYFLLYYCLSNLSFNYCFVLTSTFILCSTLIHFICFIKPVQEKLNSDSMKSGIEII